jgi:hypothetical protein
LRLFFLYLFYRSYCLVIILLLWDLWSRGLRFFLGHEIAFLDLSDVVVERFVGCLFEQGLQIRVTHDDELRVFHPPYPLKRFAMFSLQVESAVQRSAYGTEIRVLLR